MFTAILYLSVARTGSFRAPLIASALWLIVSIVGGVIYPAIVQGLVVNPDQEAKEAGYIERNVNATRLAYGLAEVDVRDVTFGPLTASDVESDLERSQQHSPAQPGGNAQPFHLRRGS